MLLVPFIQANLTQISSRANDKKLALPQPAHLRPIGAICTTSAKPNRHSQEAPLTGCLFLYAAAHRAIDPQAAVETAASGKTGQRERRRGVERERNDRQSGSGPCRCMA